MRRVLRVCARGGSEEVWGKRLVEMIADGGEWFAGGSGRSGRTFWIN